MASINLEITTVTDRESALIVFVNGRVTVEELQSIEKDFQSYQFEDVGFGIGEHSFKVNYVNPETQTGKGYGDILTLNGYWDFEIA